MNNIYQPYGWCLNGLNDKNRDQTSTATYGDGVNFTDCVPRLIEPIEILGPQNTNSVNKLDQYFFNQQTRLPSGSTPSNYNDNPINFASQNTNIDLQTPRPTETKVNSYITLASQSLHISPDTLMNVFFSDSNLNHLRNTIVLKDRC